MSWRRPAAKYSSRRALGSMPRLLRDELGGHADAEGMAPEAVHVEGLEGRPCRTRRSMTAVERARFFTVLTPSMMMARREARYLGPETVVGGVDELEDPAHEDGVELDNLVEIDGAGLRVVADLEDLRHRDG